MQVWLTLLPGHSITEPERSAYQWQVLQTTVLGTKHLAEPTQALSPTSLQGSVAQVCTSTSILQDCLKCPFMHWQFCGYHCLVGPQGCKYRCCMSLIMIRSAIQLADMNPAAAICSIALDLQSRRLRTHFSTANRPPCMAPIWPPCPWTPPDPWMLA